jgi:phosphoglycolate phosphatase
MAARALIFDVDGTLWDSIGRYARVLADLSGADQEAVLQKLRDGASAITLAQQLGVSRKVFFAECIKSTEGITLYPGVAATLTELDGRGVPCGIASSLSGHILGPLLDAHRMSGFFRTVIHPGIVRARKPHPRSILTALEEMGFSEGEGVFYVGDRATDAQAAAAARVHFAWASYGYEAECPAQTHTTLTAFSGVLSL